MSSNNASTQNVNAIVLARHNIALIGQWAAKLDYKLLSADILRCYAIQYAFITIAEAIKDIPQSVLQKYNSLAYWRDIIDFRNHLTHTYEDILDHRIMDTIHSDIPELDRILEKMLSDMGGASS